MVPVTIAFKVNDLLKYTRDNTNPSGIWQVHAIFENVRGSYLALPIR